MTVRRTPFFFGDSRQSLFGWYHAPAEPMERDLVMVVCPPIGHEYINSHRSMRRLADSVAAAGVPALRFDYHGTGDSSGQDEDPARVSAWTSSIHTAMAAAREQSGCENVGLVGVRFGATLAALVAAEVDVDCLVLWGACVRGRSYARELKALALTGGNRAASSAEHIEPGGFVFTSETQRDIGCIDARTVAPRAKRALIVFPEDAHEDRALRDTWRAAGIAADQIDTTGMAEMFLPPHSAVVPERTIADIARWVASGAPWRASEAASSRGEASPRTEQQLTAAGGQSLRESVVRLGTRGDLFAIVCEPAGAPRPGAPMILLPNAGSTHHVGPNRLYVFVARALAAAGFRSLRFDLPGLGDSDAEPNGQENDPYLPTASDVVARAMSAIRAQRPDESFLLMGLCSGAHTSFHAALDLSHEPIVECVLINPLTFYYKRGTPLDDSSTNHYHEWQRYMRSMRSLEGWAKLLRDDVHLVEIGRTIYQRFRDIAKKKVESFRERSGAARRGEKANDLEGDVQRLVESGRKLTFVFSRFDPGYDLLMINAGRSVKRLRKRGAIRMWTVDDANHTFEARHSRLEMIQSLADHLAQRYPE